LLEFLDPDLHVRYDFGQSWNSSDNMTLAGMMKKDGPYYCPSDFDRGQCDTSYVMLVGANAISDGPTARKSKEITDDPHTTIIVVEMSHSGIYWTEPRDLNVPEMSFKTEDPSRPCMRSAHQSPGVVNVLFADGSVSAIFPDKLPLRMIEKYPVAVEHPAVTGPPGANGGAVVAGELAGIYFKQQHPVQLPRRLGVRLIHAHFIYRRGHNKERDLVVSPLLEFHRGWMQELLSQGDSK